MLLSKSNEILRPLESNEVKELLNLYEVKYGTKNFHYLLLYNQCKWDQKLEELGINKNTDPETDKKWNAFRKTFYTHRNSDFRKFGTYISLHYDTIQSVSFNSWEPGYLELYECLQKTNLINWSSGPLLTNVNLEYCERVKEIAASKGIGVQRARLCHGLIMPNEKALQLKVSSLPSGYEVRELQIKHADIIHENWANKKEGSLDYIRGLIQINKSLGLFRLSDDTLVAWIIQNDFSGLGFLQVITELQRNGFASILTSSLSKAISESEKVEISTWIVNENYKSIALFEKNGFQKSVLNEWIQLNRCN